MDHIYEKEELIPVHSKYWWSAFILCASFTGAGLGPIDTGLIDMATNYFVIIVLLGVSFALLTFHRRLKLFRSSLWGIWACQYCFALCFGCYPLSRPRNQS